MTPVKYFAYGSNMLTMRLQERIGSVELHGAGWITGHQLRFHKVSRDGSGKCDIHETGSPGHVVHGVVFEIADHQKLRLDEFEGLGRGYTEKRLQVSLAVGRWVTAAAYVATDLDGGLFPYAWYHRLVVAGAREHGLPATYIEEIASIRCIDDPDESRAATHQRLVP